MKDVIIGIDLGTSTTEAAVFRDGKAELILNFENEKITPSAVGIDDHGNFVVGARAKAQYLLNPDRTAIEIKRKMGSDEKISLGKQSYTPVELSAKILDYVKRYAEAYLDCPINRAVISVPAYFDDIQRRETMEAGRKAGLTVERIINEPTAAALSYGLDHMEEESYVLVYDLGGGTFDVTLLEMFDGVLEVKASSGDNHLGGKDFDETIVNWLADRFYDKHQIRLQEDVYAMARLKEEAEKCKILLSSQEAVQISIPMLAEKDQKPLALEETIRRSQFEEWIAGLVQKTHDPISLVLADSGVRVQEIGCVLLVGGSTRAPLIKQDVEQFLGITAYGAVNPDFSVAEGAAIQAGIISGTIAEEDSLMMTDVNPYTLGIRTCNERTTDYMSVVIPRNVTIPVTRKEHYYTSYPFQTEAEIVVYQGESVVASSNHFLGKFTVGGIPPQPAGEEGIDVEFSYDLNGILQVTATVSTTGKAASITINMTEAAEKPEERIDVSGWKDAPKGKQFRAIIRRAEKFYKQMSKELEAEELTELEDMIYELKKAIIENNEDLDIIEDYLVDMLDLLEEE